MADPDDLQNGGSSNPDNKTGLLQSTKRPYPKAAFFILGNEFCERYSFYGMRTILVLYLKYYMLMSDNTSTAVYHAFTVLCYLFPIIGAFIADSWLGKYRTILYLSIVYGIGMMLNTMGATPTLGNLSSHLALTSIGLIVIAIGTGGIKACVASFGGDQFYSNQVEYRRRFYSMFYFAINAGSLISTIVSPIMRESVQCFGRDDCYALAFGIPAILMIIAIITFVAGTPLYRKHPPEGNVFAGVCRGIWSAMKGRWNTPRSERRKEHWMDYASADIDAGMVRDTRYLLRVLVLFIPLPVFWTLFDQQGSRWTLQATRMNGYAGSLRIKPDQAQVLNPLLIVTLIPLMEVTLYPCLRKLNFNFSPLRRMTAGMIMAGLAFVVAGLVQTQMDKTLTSVPEQSNQASFRLVNTANCKIHAFTDIYPDWSRKEGKGILLNPGQASDTLQNFVDKNNVGKTFVVEYNCANTTDKKNETILLGGRATWNMVISQGETGLRATTFEGISKKSEDGGATIRVFNSLLKNITIVGLGSEPAQINTNKISTKWNQDKNNYTIQAYEAHTGRNIANRTCYFDTGGVYTILVWNNESVGVMEKFTDVNPNVVSIFWIIPQYFIITVGEVFLSVTGSEFSYSQAPPSMKAVLSSFWLLTNSIGNLITLIIAESKFVSSQTEEYYLFAGLIGVATILFIILAVRYKYVSKYEFEETRKLPETASTRKIEEIQV